MMFVLLCASLSDSMCIYRVFWLVHANVYNMYTYTYIHRWKYAYVQAHLLFLPTPRLVTGVPGKLSEQFMRVEKIQAYADPKAPCRSMVYTWAFKGLPYHNFGVCVYTPY